MLIRVKLAGICGTDLEMLSGYKSLPGPQVLGHEFVGLVESYGSDVPPAQQLPSGTRVVAEINCVSPDSASRTAAERAQDPHRTALGIFGHPGAFAQFVTVPAINVHKVPDNVLDEAAVFAEPMAAACQILNQVQLPRDEPVAVLGAGRLGWLVAGVLATCGCEVVMLSRKYQDDIRRVRDEKISLEFGVRFDTLGDAVKEDQFAVVVDCTGASSGFMLAIKLVKPRGTIVLKSTTAPGSGEKVDLTPLVVKEITLQGSRCGPFPVALRLLEKNVFDPRSLLETTFDAKDAHKAFQHAAEKGTLKVLLRFP